MTRTSRSKSILIGIGILVLLVSLWVDWDGPQDRSSNLTPQPSRDAGTPDSVSARERDAERAPVRLEPPEFADPEETAPNQSRPPQPFAKKKRRALQSTIAGIVANSQDGAPIRQARLTSSPAGNEDAQFVAVSGSGGRFQLNVRGVGWYKLRAEAAGFRPYFTDQLRITPVRGSLQKNILMTPHSELRGRVVDRQSRGIAGASVWLREETPGPFDKKSMVRSDESGRFLMAKPPVSGTYLAQAAHSEHELDSHVPVALPTDDEVVITMRRIPDPLLASISGRVWDTEGHPILGATVNISEIEPSSQLSIHHGASSTDPTGHYHFSKVRSGAYLVIAEADGFALAIGGQGNRTLTIEPSGKYEIDLILARQTTVQGVVTNEEGLPVAMAGVFVRFEKGTGLGAFTPSDGTFDIPEVPPGRHQLQVTHPEYLTYDSVLVTPTDQFLALNLQPGLSLTGVVLDQHSAPMRDFSLQMQPTSGRGLPKTSEVSRSDGYFRVSGLAPQVYVLSVRLANAESFETRFELMESTNVTIELAPSDAGSQLQIRRSSPSPFRYSLGSP